MKTLKSNNSVKRNNQNKDSFLEAFRDLGSDLASTATDNLVKPGLGDIKNELFPFTRPGSAPEPTIPQINNFDREKAFEARYRSRLQRTEIVHREEKILFTRQQKETQRQVNMLQEEIKKMAKTTGDLAKEVEVASMQNIPVAGDYHVNFLTRLRKLIASLRSQIQESSYWLASWNKKAQKRNFYWGQFKKSGSKFMLSADRYMATQAG